jgi:hypothetical protein
MADILVRGLSPELEAALQSYASGKRLSASQAVAELLQKHFELELADSSSSAGVPVGDYLAETLKEALHTKDEAAEFIRSRE